MSNMFFSLILAMLVSYSLSSGISHSFNIQEWAMMPWFVFVMGSSLLYAFNKNSQKVFAFAKVKK